MMHFSRKAILLFFFLFSSLYAADTQGFLTREDIALFYQQGFLLKPQCLDEEEMINLKENVTETIDRALEEISHSKDLPLFDSSQMLHINGSRVVFKQPLEKSISIERINGCGGMQPHLLSVLRSEKMVHTFFELLGTTELEHIISQIHPKLPGDKVAYPRHQDIKFRKSFDPDWEDILGNGSYAICIIPVDSMTAENGGLWIDKNSYPESLGLEEDLIWIDAQPGDLLFLHPYLAHGSGPNHSNESRKTLLTGFCAYGANHKAYPGAYVNTCFTLTEEGKIEMTNAPWSQEACMELGRGH